MTSGTQAADPVADRAAPAYRRVLGTPASWHDRPARIALTGALASLVTALVALAAVDVIVHRIVLHDLRNYLERTALATAALIDGDEFLRFTHPEQDTTEEYRQASRPLRVLLQTNPDIRFAYSGVTRGKRMHFVLDGSPLDARDSSGVSEHAAPMHEDVASPGEIEVTRTHQVTVETAPSATAWGFGIRAQAPIFARDGRMVGYVGLTMRADRYAYLIHRTDVAASLGALIAACLAGVTGLGILRTQRFRELAEQQNALLTERLRRERDRLSLYAQALDHAEEEVRRATAVYLHEDVGQVLAGLSMMLSTARGSNEFESQKALIANAADAAQAAQSGIGTVIQDLWPPELEQASLTQIMTWIASLFLSRHAFKVSWVTEGEATLTRDQLMLIYRLVREVIAELERQSTTRAADLKIRLSAERIELQVMEKSAGFQQSRGNQRQGEDSGLVLARQRVRAAGGKFELISLPGGGRWAAVVIPTVQSG